MAASLRGESRTDWPRVDAMTEDELERSIADDPDWRDIPEDWYRDAERVVPMAKTPLSLRLDGDVVAFFKATGRGYQTRMNAVLRAYMRAALARPR